MSSMLLQHLITFARVVETGSFTRAAQALNLSQPSVTKHVSSLEAFLGIQLLDRDGRRLRLTPAGEAVYAYAKRIHQAVLDCQAAVQAIKSPDVGMVTVGSVHTIGLYTLPDLLADFARAYPLVRLMVKTAPMAQTLNLLLQHEIDIGLVTAPVSHERVECIPLFEDPVLVVTSPEPRFPLPDPVVRDDLGRLPVIGYQRGSRYRSFVDAALEGLGIHPQVVMEFDSHEATKAVAALGLGIALVPASAARRDLQEGKLVEVRVQGLPRIARTTCMILRRDGRLSPAAENLAGFIRERFRSRELAAVRPAPPEPGRTQGAAG